MGNRSDVTYGLDGIKVQLVCPTCGSLPTYGIWKRDGGSRCCSNLACLLTFHYCRMTGKVTHDNPMACCHRAEDHQPGEVKFSKTQSNDKIYRYECDDCYQVIEKNVEIDEDKEFIDENVQMNKIGSKIWDMIIHLLPCV